MMIRWRRLRYHRAMRRITILMVVALLGCGPSGGSGGGKKKSDAAGAGDEGSLQFPDAPGDPGEVEGEDALVPPAEDVDTPLQDLGPPPIDNGPPPDVFVPPPDNGPPKTDLGPPTGPVTGGVLVAQVEGQVQYGNLGVRYRWGTAPTATVVMDLGACKVVTSNGDPTAPPPDPAPGLDGGAVTVTGLNQPMLLSPKDMGPQQGFVYDSGLAKDNTTILGGAPSVSVQAAGGDHVSAWATSVAVPSPVTISSPSGGVFDTVNKDSSLTFQWNATGADQVNIFLFGANQDGAVAGNAVTCTISGDPGSFTVPAQAMQMLPGDGPMFPGLPGEDFIAYGVTRIVVSTVSVSGGSVALSVTRTDGNIVGIK